MAASFIIDDLDVILSPEVFGVDDGVTWNGAKIPNAIFDDETIEVQLGEGVGELIPQPMVTGKTSDFIGIATDDPMMIKTPAGNETFYVKNWKPDGTGAIEIYLSRDVPTP